MHKVKFVTTILMAVLILAPSISHANSTPVYMYNHPSFEIAPMTDSPLVLLHELLTFEVGASAAEAMVTAQYLVKNTSQERVAIPLLFPAVSEVWHTPYPHITFEGKPLSFEKFGAGEVRVEDYLQDPKAFTEQVDINTIIANLNRPAFSPSHFVESDKVTLYAIKFGPGSDRQSTISFRMDPARTRVVASSYSGMEYRTDGQVRFSTFVTEPGATISLVVLGDDTLEDIVLSQPDTLAEYEVVIKDYLYDRVINDYRYHFLEHRNKDNLYSMLAEELDLICSPGYTGAVSSLEDIVYGAIARNNISAFLFTLELDAESKGQLIVSYPVRATIDRSKSNNYVNTFVYILNPARNFTSFDTLDVDIRLNSHAPYIIDSSIPLTQGERGRYSLSLGELPAVDLVFSTYSEPQISYLERLGARVLAKGYFRNLLLIIAAFALLLSTLVLAVRLSRRASPGIQADQDNGDRNAQT
jgi:hypothetical protein